MSPEESFHGLPQLIFGFKASSVECLALQQAEHDFNLVQPTGRSRREVKPDSSFELCQPVVVSLMSGIVIEDDMDVPVLRLIGQHAMEKAAKVFPPLVFGEFRVNLARVDFQGGEQIQSAVAFVGALQPAHHFTAVGLHLTGDPFDRLYGRFFVYAQNHGV